MILRVFRARVRAGKLIEFKRLVEEVSVPLLKRQTGLVSYFAGQPLGMDADEFVMVTLWNSLDDLRSFAGDQWHRPVVPTEELPLVRLASAEHYELFQSDRLAGATR